MEILQNFLFLIYKNVLVKQILNFRCLLIIKQNLVRESTRLLCFYLNNIVKYLTVVFRNISHLNQE